MEAAAGGPTELDPVCGMAVDPATAAGQATFLGVTYFISSPGCKATFDQDPPKYADTASKGHKHAR